MPKYYDAESLKIQIKEKEKRELEKIKSQEYIPGRASEARMAYMIGIEHALQCIDEAEGEEVVPGIRCGKCEYWHRNSKKWDIGYCLAVYEDNFPFHCDHPPITRKDFSCDFAKKKEEVG